MDDNKFGVPAGWYPDPLGLPQLRWWDSQAWTEHTSEARAPIILQPSTRVGYVDDDEQPANERREYAEDDLPSRRVQRERERRETDYGQTPDYASRDYAQARDYTTPEYAETRDFTHASNLDYMELDLETDEDGVRDELSAQPLLAMTLRELEPPPADTVDEDTPGPRRASSHANATPAASTLSALAEEMEQAPVRELKQAKTYTGAVWAIALMPLVQLVVNILVITVAGLGHNLPILLVIVLGPYLLVLGFAAYDKLLLQTWGHKNPASVFWALLSQPGYLIVRAIRTFKETGKGFAPLAVFAATIVTVLASVIAVPGLIIAVFPGTFASEVEQSVQADARALGAEITVDCPAPPLLIGDMFTCIRTSTDGETDSVAVSLQRQNGWIAWRVEDWGTSLLDG